jgi:hypothetical protein
LIEPASIPVYPARDAAALYESPEFSIARRAVTPAVKAEVDGFVSYCESTPFLYCVVAIRTNGSKAGFAKAPRGFQARVDRLRRTAITNCGSTSSCSVVYEDGIVRTAVVPQ